MLKVRLFPNGEYANSGNRKPYTAKRREPRRLARTDNRIRVNKTANAGTSNTSSMWLHTLDFISQNRTRFRDIFRNLFLPRTQTRILCICTIAFHPLEGLEVDAHKWSLRLHCWKRIILRSTGLRRYINSLWVVLPAGVCIWMKKIIRISII